MSTVDVVYVVREGDANEELRYSLRSLRNLDHDRVFIAGYTPDWVRGAVSIDVDQPGTKWANSTRNLKAACSDPRVGDEFVLMNDDFFVLEPVGRVPLYDRGPLDDVMNEYSTRVRNNRHRRRYYDGIISTSQLLQRRGYKQRLLKSYELHVPMPVQKDLMLYVIEQGEKLPVLHKRTLYGNLSGLPSETTTDVKVSVDAPVIVTGKLCSL